MTTTQPDPLALAKELQEVASTFDLGTRTKHGDLLRSAATALETLAGQVKARDNDRVAQSFTYGDIIDTLRADNDRLARELAEAKAQELCSDLRAKCEAAWNAGHTTPKCERLETLTEWRNRDLDALLGGE